MKPASRTRARQACLACNSRRVKCDAVKQTPCTNCKATGSNCVIPESRRGKHPRKPRNTKIKQRNEPEVQEEAHTERAPLLLPFPKLGNSTIPEPAPEAAISAGSPRGSVDAASVNWAGANSPSRSSSFSEHSLSEASGPDHARQVSNANLGAQSGNDFSKTGVKVQQKNTTRGDTSPAQIEEDLVCLGESTAICYLHNAHVSTGASGDKSNPLVCVSADLRAQNPTSVWDVERRQTKMRRLQADGALSFPAPDAVDNLLTAYFRWFHPCFPIVDEVDIKFQYKKGTISPLLLQAMHFVGVMHCDDEALLLVNLGSRQRAKYIFYNRAKDIFDAEIESKDIVVIQALFLMSFWRAGVPLQKDTRHWLGAAVSLAQTKGLHRSSPSQNINNESQKLRKRLWWSIYIRERQCAAALGLPNRVRDEDCDIETLHESDFEFAFDPSSPTGKYQRLAFWMIGMAELSRILGRIVHRDYLPSKRLGTTEREEIRAVISNWKSDSSNITQFAAEECDLILGFQVNMMNLAYNNLLILLYRSGCPRPNFPGDDVSMRVVLQAASRNTSIIEDMVVEGTMCHAQIHVITNVFNTLCVHTLTLRRSEGGRRYVSENRAKICLLGLRELQKTWEVKNWILQLFFQYLDQPTATRLQLGADVNELQASIDETVEVQNDPEMNPNSQQMEIQSFESSLVSDSNWPMNTEDVGFLFHAQIENNFINGEGGPIDWYMADILDPAFRSQQEMTL